MGHSDSKNIKCNEIYQYNNMSFQYNGKEWLSKNLSTGIYEYQNNVVINFDDIIKRFGFDELFMTENRVEMQTRADKIILNLLWSSSEPYLMKYVLEDLNKGEKRIDYIDITELLEVSKFSFFPKKKVFELTQKKDFGQKIIPNKKKMNHTEYITKIYNFKVNPDMKELVITPMRYNSHFINTKIDISNIYIVIKNILEAYGLDLATEA
uniref:Uncharacterized protein n=1 Tax=viral metagenome TaxID=1070528 RepID=A0A6C0ACA4_9ZZZZ